MAEYMTLTNKMDGVVSAAEDNKDDGVVGTDADDAGYQMNLNPVAIPAGKNNGYKGPGDTTLTIGDPRFA